MSDIVKRLRTANTWLNEGDCCGQLDASGTCMAPACIFGEALTMANEAAARIEQLEGQHKGLVLQNALLRQRPDLPVDRIPAAAEVRALIARIEQLEAALREIASVSIAQSDRQAWAFCQAIARAALGEKETRDE